MTEKPNSVCKWCRAPIVECKKCDFSPICKGYNHVQCGHYCYDAGGRAKLAVAEMALSGGINGQ